MSIIDEIVRDAHGCLALCIVMNIAFAAAISIDCSLKQFVRDNNEHIRET